MKNKLSELFESGKSIKCNTKQDRIDVYRILKENGYTTVGVETIEGHGTFSDVVVYFSPVRDSMAKAILGEKAIGWSTIPDVNVVQLSELMPEKKVSAQQKQYDKWVKRAEKRGFVPGVSFLGVEGADKDRIITIGEDGVQVNDMGTYYGDSYIMFTKGDDVKWAHPLCEVVPVEKIGLIDDGDFIGVEATMEEVHRMPVVFLGSNAKKQFKFSLAEFKEGGICGVRYCDGEKVTLGTKSAVVVQVIKGYPGTVRILNFRSNEALIKWAISKVN